VAQARAEKFSVNFARLRLLVVLRLCRNPGIAAFSEISAEATVLE
jgi:hypothetical protein